MDEGKLLEDFKSWSGGFEPSECDTKDVHIYVIHNLSKPDEAKFIYEKAGVTLISGMPII